MLRATWRTSQTEKGIFIRSEVEIFVIIEFPKKSVFVPLRVKCLWFN